jgi:predicted nucleic acid-binding protein
MPPLIIISHRNVEDLDQESKLAIALYILSSSTFLLLRYAKEYIANDIIKALRDQLSVFDDAIEIYVDEVQTLKKYGSENVTQHITASIAYNYRLTLRMNNETLRNHCERLIEQLRNMHNMLL